jgi:hypothetical protein
VDRAGRLPPHRGGRGRVAVPHLTLTFDAAGLALDKTDGEPVWFCGRDQLREMSPVEHSVLATDDPGSTEPSVRDRADSHGLGGSPERPRVSRALNMSIVVAVATVMAVLLLSAFHLIQF